MRIRNGTVYDVSEFVGRVVRLVPELGPERRASLIVSVRYGEEAATASIGNVLLLRLPSPWRRTRKLLARKGGKVVARWVFSRPPKTAETAAAMVRRLRKMVGLPSREFEARFDEIVDRLGEFLPLMPRRRLRPRPPSVEEARRYSLLRRLTFHWRRKQRAEARIACYKKALEEAGS